MLRRQRQIRTQLHKLIDGGLFALGFWGAHWIRLNWQSGFLDWQREIEPFEDFLLYFLLMLPLAPLLLEMHGFYNRPLIPSRRLATWQLFKSCFLGVIALILVMFLMKGQLARSVFILSGGLGFLLVFAKEELTRMWVRTKMGQAQLKKRLILIGAEDETEALHKELRAMPQEGVEIVAKLNLNKEPVQRLVELLHEHSINGVIVSPKHTFFGEIEKAIQACELEGVEVWLLADFFKTQISQTGWDDLNGRPMLVFRSAPEFSWAALAKQIMDIVGALLLILVLLPVFVVVIALIKVTSPGPVLFRQKRSGLNGQPFTMLKFRSMVSDAEQRKQELAVFNEMAGPVFKISNDPRITPVGRFLRRYSIDELPQLFNVLRGEMSLVGPRPLPVDEVQRFDDFAHRRRLSVKPGLTCLWQISGRNNVSDFKDWVRLDLEYIDNWSLWLDLKILLRTIPAVLFGTGAK